ncbi:hypothetical protein Rhe02_66870 [Rhizocola hellebori]|uniref:DUF5709 domain-containing protein n=1 Tax=Rhizocola hellebori TaxID=1392758 RepID=A0A8J3VJF3_9ACTN|nr:DUF5709 domain-containing protein [Rhizocola hellebori]GIH08620.1 hypothetical protein Rhe02_66870 [Rhizocola hellebori]
MTYPRDEERLDPDAEGLPSVADDTSTAFDEPEGRMRDDTAPALPSDEPLGLDHYGVTAAEAAHREPLKARLLREEPEVDARDIDDTIDSIDLNEPPSRRIGRLEDTDSQSVAYETGETLGLSAEEAAMHEVPEEGEEDDQ